MEENEIYEEETETMKRNRAERRKNDYKKAKRKQDICHNVLPSSCNEYYNNLHAYSKNKIHCSCPMCSAKSGRSNSIHDKKISDIKKRENLKYQEEDYSISE